MAPDYKRRLTRRILAFGALAFLGAVDCARAHHSFSAFDLDSQRTVRGIVVSFEWTNPHVVTKIEPESGSRERTVASFEGMSPDYLGRRGWNRSTMQPGETVEIVYFPRKDGRPGGMFLRATLADGTLKVMLDPD
jgi:hypothetical protein